MTTPATDTETAAARAYFTAAGEAVFQQVDWIVARATSASTWHHRQPVAMAAHG